MVCRVSFVAVVVVCGVVLHCLLSMLFVVCYVLSVVCFFVVVC